MRRLSPELGRLCHPAFSLSPSQHRTVTTWSPNTFRSHAPQVDHPRKTSSGSSGETSRILNQHEEAVVKRRAMSVFDRAANWAHAKPQRKRRVPSPGVVRQSLEKILSIPPDFYDDEVFNTNIEDEVPPKGSFLEIRRNNAVLHTIAMGAHYTGRTRQILTLTTTGEAIPFNHTDIMLCIPGFVGEKLIDSCGSSKLHSTNEELTARTRVLARLRIIGKEIESAVRYVDNRAAKFYDHLKSENPHEWKKIDVQTATRFFNRPGKVDSHLATTIAVHKHLMDHPRNFVAHPTAYRATQTFMVRPAAQVQNISDVTGWLHIGGGRILNEFCDKAKVITHHAKSSRHLTTPHEIPTEYTPTDSDREILRFLLDALHVQRLTQNNPHSLVTNYILKRLDLLDDTEWPVSQLGPLQQLLADLGVLTPWTDGASIASRIESLAHTPVMKLLSPPPFPRKPLGPEDFYANDPLEALRHDFGDTEVFVIDDASASELDDGVSIEAIPSQPEHYWVHVHVADPTTLLPPTHILAYRARELSVSSYSANGTNFMLPPVTFEKFSLGYTAAKKEPQQVMTFSFKVDEAGDLVDYKVRAAIVKNVHTLTYDAVDATLGLPSCAPTFPFKLPDPSPPSYPPVEPGHVEQLKLLYKVSSRLIANRVRLPIFTFVVPASETRFTCSIPPHLPHPASAADPLAMRRFRLYDGFPDMSYSVTHPDSTIKGSRAMISEFMKGACRVASRFGVETGTPLVRRHGMGPIGPDPADIERLVASRDEFGTIDQYEAAKCSVTLPRAVNTLTPRGHWALGIPDGEGYVRVTSPLRRYADLVAHWQIKQALLANSDPARFPKGKRVVFGEAWLSQYARELTFRDQEAKRASGMSNDYWNGVFVKRWLDGKIESETLDPKTAVFEARPGARMVKDHLGRYRVRSMIPQLGLWGEIIQDDPLETGSRVKVRIAGVGVGPRPGVQLAPV